MEAGQDQNEKALQAIAAKPVSVFDEHHSSKGSAGMHEGSSPDPFLSTEGIEIKGWNHQHQNSEGVIKKKDSLKSNTGKSKYKSSLRESQMRLGKQTQPQSCQQWRWQLHWPALHPGCGFTCLVNIYTRDMNVYLICLLTIAVAHFGGLSIIFFTPIPIDL